MCISIHIYIHVYIRVHTSTPPRDLHASLLSRLPNTPECFEAFRQSQEAWDLRHTISVPLVPPLSPYSKVYSVIYDSGKVSQKCAAVTRRARIQGS